MSINFVFLLMFSNVINILAGRVALTFYALHLGARPIEIGMLAGTFALMPMLLSWYSGRVTDRFGARWPIMIASAGSSLGMLVPYFFARLESVYFAAVMLGFTLAFFSVSTQNLVGLLSTEQNRTRNFSTYTMLASVGAFLGPMFAGFSVDHAGYGATLLFLVALPLVPIALLIAWGDRLPKGTGKPSQTGSLKHALAAPGIWRVLAMSSFAQCGTNIFQFYVPVYARSIGMSASTIGVVLGMAAAAGFGSRMVLPLLVAKLKPANLLAGAFFVGAVCLMLVPFSSGAVTLSLLAFVFGLGMNCSQPLMMIAMYGASREGRSGETLGLRFTADNLTRVVIPVLFGMVASALGIGAVFWTCALVLASGGAFSRDKSAKLPT